MGADYFKCLINKVSRSQLITLCWTFNLYLQWFTLNTNIIMSLGADYFKHLNNLSVDNFKHQNNNVSKSRLLLNIKIITDLGVD